MSSRALLLFTLLVFSGMGCVFLLGTLLDNFGLLPTLTGLVMSAVMILFYKIGYSDGKNDCLLLSRPKAEQPTARPAQRQDPSP